MNDAQATRRDLWLIWRRSREPAPAPIAAIGAGCLTHLGTICEACRDACAARAIRAVPRLRQVPTVLVREQDCTGCGDCVAACPVSAISLSGATHA